MEAPYNNPQTLTFARMKHNACVMRSRSLHRRLVHMQLQAQQHKEDPTLDIRHSRENSNSSSARGSHSRQNSRDKTLSAQHSRQSSRELAVTSPLPVVIPACDKPASKNIEIYATLPRKKLPRNKPAENVIEDAEYMYDRPGRSLYSRGAKKRDEEKTTKEKRARSEERSKNSRDYSMLSLSSLTNAASKKEEKIVPKKEKPKEEKKPKDGKKQHKIRRKLLMGGLIRRKNRSMPDLREGEDVPEEVNSVPQEKLTQDDSALTSKQASLSGYLSEGHLEYTCVNMEKSKLMRRTSHKERNGVLPPKVPPLPPLRTTSQLTLKEDRPQYPLPDSLNNSYNQSEYSNSPNSSYQSDSLYLNAPFRTSDIYQNGNLNQTDAYQTNPNAYQHNSTNQPEPFYQGAQNVSYNPRNADGFPPFSTETVPNYVGDYPEPSRTVYPPEVTYANGGILLDNAATMFHGDSIQNLVLPPYPAAGGSGNHSRQASEEFPPPPPPLEMAPPVTSDAGGLLAQLQSKRQQILDKECLVTNMAAEPTSSAKSGEQWLKELQAKQAERRLKKSTSSGQGQTSDQSKPDPSSDNLASVRDLASRFENIRTSPATVSPAPSGKTLPESIARYPETNPTNEMITKTYDTNSLPREKPHIIQHEELRRNVPQEDSRNAIPSAYSVPRDDDVRRTTPPDVRKIPLKFDTSDVKRKSGKKKNVTFCDEVILVATADDEEDDSFIPNPILERVLRSAFKSDTTDGRAIQAEWQATMETRLIEETRPAYKQAELDSRYYLPPDQQAGFYQQVQPQQVYRTGEPNRTSDPRTQTLDPRTQTLDPRTQISDPRMQTSDPRTQITDPRMQISDSRIQITDPRTQLSDPRMQLTDPRTQISDPRTQITDPRMQISDPRTLVPSDPRIQMDPRNLVQPQIGNDPRTAISPDIRNPMLGDPNRSYLQSNPRPVAVGYQTNVQQSGVHPSNSPQYRDLLSQPQSPQQQGYQPKQPQYTQQIRVPMSNVQQYPYPTKSVPQAASNVQPTYQQVPQPSSQQQKQPNYQHLPQQMPQKSSQMVNQHSAQVYQQLPQAYQQLPQTYQQLPQSHQQLIQNHQQLVQNQQQIPQNHQQLPINHQQLPQNHQQLPQNHQQNHQTMQTHPQLPQNHQQLPLNHQQLPQNHQQLPQNHQQMPQNHQQLPQNYQQNHQTLQTHPQSPQNHQQVPLNHQQIPQNHPQMSQNHPQTPQQTQSPSIYQQMPHQPSQTLSSKQPLPAQGVYQRATPPSTSYPPYQHPPPPRTLDPSAKAAPCHLCRKKPVVAPAVYCTDCHFYMSRFKPRT